ncbi:MAG TPA: hypothetical protein VFD44_05535, partial [Hanamia sp.]|nr:hypothetical protein [Hanamia sp.]
LDIESFDDQFARHTITLFAEIVKFKSMWYLRKYEEQINGENGQIIISVFHRKQPIFKLNGFSDELDNKIHQIISGVDYKIDLLM